MAGVVDSFADAWLVEGVRTPFVDYNGALAGVSPIDLGIKVGREVFKRASASPDDVGMVVAGSMAQASFDAYFLPRHIALYSGAPVEAPAHLVQRVCGTGIDVLAQAADAVSRGRADLALCVGAESMSRNPVAAYTHRRGFRMGQIEFKDSCGRRCSIRPRKLRWAIPPKPLRANTRSRASRWMLSPAAASIARLRRKRTVSSPTRSCR